MIFLLKRIYLKLVKKQIIFQPAKTNFLNSPDGLIKDKNLNYLLVLFVFRKQPRNKYQTAFMVTRSVL
jgi:hypothetical protein